MRSSTDPAGTFRRRGPKRAARTLPCVLAVFISSAGADGGQPAELVEALRLRIEAMTLAGRSEVGASGIHTLEGVGRLLAHRGYALAFVAGSSVTPAVDSLLAAIAEAERHALPSCVYHADPIRALAAEPTLSVADAIDLELLATDAALTLATHVASGRVSPASFDPEWLAHNPEIDAVGAVAASLDEGTLGATLRALHPRRAGYRRLRAAYRSLERRGESAWPEVAGGSALRAGEASERVSVLAARLAASGDLDAAPADSSALDGAIRRFQGRHGLEVDGVVGPATRKMLNLSPPSIAATIALNLERWRWLPLELGARHVRVNIAGFLLEAVAGEHVERTHRVIVGRAYRRTPVFTATMRYLVLNPSWEVPPTILENDLVPEIRRNPTLLVDRGIDLLSGWGDQERTIDAAAVDWSTISPARFPYRLRQRPGPTNPLGRVKLIFPNAFSVYMHDTNAPGLFEKALRTASSGWIRVDDALTLSEWVLDDPIQWERARITQALESGREQTVPLRAPLPVHLLYWTAWVDEDGTVQIRPDVYARDVRLQAALTGVSRCE